MSLHHQLFPLLFQPICADMFGADVLRLQTDQVPNIVFNFEHNLQ